MNDNTPYLIVGLGNPGPKYHNNRHNVGFMVADALGDTANIPIRRFEFKALIGKGDYVDERLILAKPQTYMNNSGQAVSALVNFYKIPTEKILVIHDDLDLPFGTLRMRPQGGAGGQRGVGSIIAKLNTQNFARLRVGIGRPPGRMDPSDYVLHDFDRPEEEMLPEILDTAVKAIGMFLREDIELAMNKFNGPVIGED